MTRTIEIKFTANPALNDTFRYTIKLDGAALVYDSSLQTVDKHYLSYSSAPNGIMRGATLPVTIANTVSHLQALNKKPGIITYTSSPTSIFVTITFNGTIAVDNVGATGPIIIDPNESELVVQDGLDSGQLYKAWNNHIITFQSTGENPTYATVTTDGINAKLYPGPDGKFFFNFKPYITSLINTRRFADTLNPVILPNNPGSFVYDFTEGTYFEKNISLAIMRDDGAVDEGLFSLAWLAAVEQPGDYHYFERSGFYVLTPFARNTTTQFYLKYWEGYPFDIPLYYPNPMLYLRNATTGFTQPFEMRGRVNRLAISDGRTNISLESLLPLAGGYNSLRLMPGSIPSRKDKFLTLVKMPYQCGVYLKWLNKYGCYNYWLFENTYAVDRSAKSIGEMDADNYNLENMYGRTLQLGRESQDTLKLVAELLDENDRRIVEGLLESPKIYMFTGQPYARNGAREWLEVSLKTTSARLKNAREKLTNFTFDIELPQRYTQTL